LITFSKFAEKDEAKMRYGVLVKKVERQEEEKRLDELAELAEKLAFQKKTAEHVVRNTSDE